MAPKANKRAATGIAASPKKMRKADPMFAGIVATLQGADNVGDLTREMLIAMVAPSLSTPKAERHSVQKLGVTMIEEMLQDHKQQLVEAVEVAQKELTEIEGTKDTLSKSCDNAKASLEEKQVGKTAAHNAYEAAKLASCSAESELAEQKDLQTKGDAAYAALEKEKVDLTAAYEEHYKTPMDANEGPHHTFLMPFIDNLGLEDSLTSALPSSCVKTTEQRGGFDTLVLTELGKALVAKIAALEKSLVDGSSGNSERQAAVTSAEAVLDTKKLAEKTAAADLEAAATALSEAEAELSKASGDWATFEPRLQAATDEVALQDKKRMDFVEGALKEFETLRDKEPVEQEAAPLGA